VGGRGCGADGLELGLEQVLKEAPPPPWPALPGRCGVSRLGPHSSPSST